MPLSAIQPTFSGGEFAPSLHGRVDLAKYQTGLETAKNWIIHPHGGASTRPGTHYIASAADSAHKVRIVPFVSSDSAAYVLEFGHGYVRFYQNGAQLTGPYNSWASTTTYAPWDFVTHSGTKYKCLTIHTAGSFDADLAAGKWVAQDAYEISSPYSEGDLFDLKFAQSADVLFITHRDYPPRKLVRNADTDYGPSWGRSPIIAWANDTSDKMFESLAFSDGPFMSANTNAAITQSIDVAAWVTATAYTAGQYVKTGGQTYKCLADHTSGVFATDLAAGKWIKTVAIVGGTVNINAFGGTSFVSSHVGALWCLRHAISNQNINASLAGGAKSDAIPCGGTWRIYTSGTWTGSVVIEKSIDGGTTWKPVHTFPAQADSYGDTGEEQCLIRVNRPTTAGYYDLGGGGTPSQTGTAVIDLSSDPFEWKSIVKITSYTSGYGVTGTCQNMCLYGLTTDDWAEGSWSSYRGYPSVICFFQDRLVFGASGAEPQNVWLTETSNYTSFARSTPLVDSDAITINLPSRKLNEIKNLIPLGELIAVTSSADWAIGSDSGVITPTSVRTRPQGERGCSSVQPVVIGNTVIAAQPRGSVIREMAYDFASNSYTGNNLSILSNHLFTGYSIVDMSYAQEPDSLVWCVRSDGKMVALTYLKEQEVLAWTPHETSGLFESVCSIPGDGYNEVWFVVNRDGVRMIERLDPRTFTSITDAFCVDSGVTYDGAPATTITGLSHLNGKAVSVLADGSVISGKTVSGGQITLTTPASVVHVGLGYTCDLGTLKLEFPTREGTAQGRKVKMSTCTIRLLNSVGGQIGNDSSSLLPIITRTASVPAGSPTPLFEGDHKITLKGGWDDGGKLFVRQEDPLPMTVLALIPQIEVGG